MRGQPGVGAHSRVCNQKARQEGIPALHHPIQDYFTPPSCIPYPHWFPPPGADYVPLAEMPTLREAIINNSDFEALQKKGPSGRPSSHPSPPGLPSPCSVQPGPISDPCT